MDAGTLTLSVHIINKGEHDSLPFKINEVSTLNYLLTSRIVKAILFLGGSWGSPIDCHPRAALTLYRSTPYRPARRLGVVCLAVLAHRIARVVHNDDVIVHTIDRTARFVAGLFTRAAA